MNKVRQFPAGIDLCGLLTPADAQAFLGSSPTQDTRDGQCIYTGSPQGLHRFTLSAYDPVEAAVLPRENQGWNGIIRMQELIDATSKAKAVVKPIGGIGDRAMYFDKHMTNPPNNSATLIMWQQKGVIMLLEHIQPGTSSVTSSGMVYLARQVSERLAQQL